MATLLIVDDEVDICEIVEDTFKQEKGFVVLKAFNGPDGVDLAKAHHPDVILLDIKLYGFMDGIEVLGEIKRYLPKCKVIIITGFSDNVTENETKNLGAFSYLEKPFNPPQIVEIVKEALQKKWSEESG